jgi:hypothetical protein
LMDVFTAMLSLCAVARKYVMIGRFSMYAPSYRSLLTLSREVGNEFSFW